MANKRKRESKPRKQKLISTLAGCSGPTLIKHLANSNPSVRSLSLRLLQSWLTSTSTATATATSAADDPSALISDDDLKKLWKGLFYCLWHCDKAIPQSNLINQLSSLLVSLAPPLALRYLTHFLLTLRREWPGIDHLRLDKFYLLIRRFVKSMFVCLRNYKWDLDYLGKFVDILINNAFLADDKLMGNGVNYHIVSVFLDELKGCFVPVEKEIVDLLFNPFLSVMGSSLDKILVGKVKSCVFEELLKMGKSLLEAKKNGDLETEVGYDDSVFGLIAMKIGFAGKLYEVGSHPDCLQGNRKVVFGLHEEFVKLEKEFELCGIDITIPEVDDDDDDDDEEVPQLVPIESVEKADLDMNGSAVPVNDKADLDMNGSSVPVNAKLEEAEDVLEDEEESSKRSKKAKKRSKENNNKAKKKRNGKKDKALGEEVSDVASDNATKDGNSITSNGGSSSSETESDGNLLNESVIANLQMQFEKVAAELGSDEDDMSLSDALVTINKYKSPKKRKRVKTAGGEDLGSSELNNQENSVVDAGKSLEKSGKKVKFAMKNNLVWKPHSPLPPQSLRLPPSATPRGSALKKGVPPGPIREMPPAKNKLKQRKGRKRVTISPGIKRLQKL